MNITHITDLKPGAKVVIPSWRGSQRADEVWTYARTVDLGGGLARLIFSNGKTGLVNAHSYVETEDPA